MTQRSQTFLRTSLGLILVAAMGALIRIWHLVDQTQSLPLIYHPVLDAKLYHDWARALAWGGVVPGVYHAPGYPQVLGLLYQLFSPNPFSVVVFQSLLGLGTTILIVMLGKRLFGIAEGVLAGLIFLAYGPIYFFEAKLLAVTLAVFLSILVVTLAVWVEGGRHRSRTQFWILIVMLGLGAGLLAVVRANLVLLFVGLLVAFVLKARKGVLPRRVPLVFAGMALLAVLPTTVSNVAQGTWAPIATNGGFNFYSGNLRGAKGIYTDVAGISGVIRSQEGEADSLVRADLGHALPPGEESRYWFRRGFREISFDTKGWFKLLGTKAWLLVHRDEHTVNGNYALESDHILLYRIARLPFNVLVFLGLVGLGLAGGWFRNKRTTSQPLASAYALLVSVLISCIVFFVMTRLRLPAVPILAVFAAHALVMGWRSWGSGSRVRVLGTGVVVVALCSVTWASSFESPRNLKWETELFMQVGNASVQQKNSPRAHKAYRLAEALNPTSLRPLMAQSQLAKDDGDLGLAIATLERAIQIDPENLDLHTNLGIACYSSGRYQDCIRVMEAATRLAPTAEIPHLYRGLALQQLGHPDAGSAYVTAIELGPYLRYAYEALAELLLVAGNPDSAAFWVARADSVGVGIPANIRSRLR